MSVGVKICGIKDKSALHAAVTHGASYIGLVFVPSSKRFISVKEGVSLIATLPTAALCRFTHAPQVEGSDQIVLTALFVDPTDQELKEAMEALPLIGLIQLHGQETPERAAQIKQLTGRPVMKAISVSSKKDLDAIANYDPVCDMLLFDSRTPDGKSGGTGTSFEWKLLQGISTSKPWMLAGGLSAINIAQAVKESGAKIVDLSSGVETEGQKDTNKIIKILGIAHDIG